MNLTALNDAVRQFKRALEDAIRTGTFDGKPYTNGHKAKEALIRSSGPIMRIHEVVKSSLRDEFQNAGAGNVTVYPPMGRTSPELSIAGFIKAKKQDVVVLADGDAPAPERIVSGPLEGEEDMVGQTVSERALVVGVRSQMSSVAKNFDTLMERAFAETLNLRLRLPRLVMGEVYLLPVFEYDNEAMESNRVLFNNQAVPVAKFIKTFLAISGRVAFANQNDFYKYERSALVLVDLKPDNPVLFTTADQLKRAGLLSANSTLDFEAISPMGFAGDIVAAHRERHSRD